MASTENRPDWFGNDPALQAIVLTRGTIEAAITALDDAVSDEREPQRYREWFQHASDELRLAVNPPT